MKSSFWKKAMPHIIAIGIFLVVAAVYCQPALQGKVLENVDNQGWRGMAQQSFEFKEKYGHFPYWTNSMFSGMPGYQIAFETPNKISIGILHNYIFTLGLPKPVNFFFLACIMAYFLFMVLRVNPWLGIMGAIAYAYSTYDPIIIAVGHDTKMICIGYAPGVIASLMLIFQKRYIIGTVLTSLFAAMILWQNHIQITYYTLIIAVAIGIAYSVHSVRNGAIKDVVIAASLAALSGLVALGVNIINLWPMNEYVKETMRGGRSELTDPANPKNKTKGGFDKDYAFTWSYGIAESLTVMVPGLYGGGSSGNQLSSGNSSFADKLTEVGQPEENGLRMANSLAYWGPQQQGTSGPVYLGAVICFLTILSLVFINHWAKWGLAGACIFGFILAWGRHFETVNYFLFDYLPLYNKFRAPTMALVIPQLCFPILACLGANELLFGGLKKEEAWKKFKLASTFTLGIFALLFIMYVSFDYTGPNDGRVKQNFVSGMIQQASQSQQTNPQLQQQAEQQASPQVRQQAEDFARGLMNGIKEDRKSLFGKDLLRSLLLVILAAGSIALYLKNKLSSILALTALVLLSSFDLLAVGKRYLNNDNFVDPTDFESVFTPTSADLKIKADTGYYRVFDQTANSPFEDARASYHHNSIGGYSPVKLALYQDIIQRQLSAGNMQVFNMLNAKYIITPNQGNGQPEEHINPSALGNAWFVKDIMIAKNADDEMNILSTLNTKDSAVIDARYQDMIKNKPVYDSTASITFVENLNDKITYLTKANSNQFAVFSEVYYPYGWDAYIDGKKTEYTRVNYVLRGMPVPAGSHKIEFRFEPRSVILSDKITMWLSILLYIMLITGIVVEYRRNKLGKPLA
ncbi:MAG: YfhO family protein [Chitinophagaceae bacterium]